MSLSHSQRNTTIIKITPEVLASHLQPTNVLRIQPMGWIRGEEVHDAIISGYALPFLGEEAAFTWMRLYLTHHDRPMSASLSAVHFVHWKKTINDTALSSLTKQLQALAAPRRDFAKLKALGRPLIMAILNVTPDSFSDGGQFLDPQAAIKQGWRLVREGADILDIGGESTRPGAIPVTAEEETERILPVISDFAKQGIPISVDSRHASTMAAALDAGAHIVNDISSLVHDPASLSLVKARSVPVVLMHMKGVPQTMQNNPYYEHAALDIVENLEYYAQRLEDCHDPSMIALDPGIGFGKTLAHNLNILAHLPLLRGLGYPLLIGVSRKSFIAHLRPEAQRPEKRMGGSLAAAIAAAVLGADILRVHDVAPTIEALGVHQAILAGTQPF